MVLMIFLDYIEHIYNKIYSMVFMVLNQNCEISKINFSKKNIFSEIENVKIANSKFQKNIFNQKCKLKIIM